MQHPKDADTVAPLPPTHLATRGPPVFAERCSCARRFAAGTISSSDSATATCAAAADAAPAFVEPYAGASSTPQRSSRQASRREASELLTASAHRAPREGEAGPEGMRLSQPTTSGSARSPSASLGAPHAGQLRGSESDALMLPRPPTLGSSSVRPSERVRSPLSQRVSRDAALSRRLAPTMSRAVIAPPSRTTRGVPALPPRLPPSAVSDEEVARARALLTLPSPARPAARVAVAAVREAPPSRSLLLVADGENELERDGVRALLPLGASDAGRSALEELSESGRQAVCAPRNY
ncbi:hypothetical protein T492DRAFT_875850 [Pavlovales sp. CCMP2436]|nr:hypothetical protein T492DRAFT_875850 [Pavlovales sp. CCMP2436]